MIVIYGRAQHKVLVANKYIKRRHSNIFCIPITFNYPLIVCFSNKKYPNTIQTPVFNEFFKIIVAQNLFLITFCSDLVCNKT